MSVVLVIWILIALIFFYMSHKHVVIFLAEPMITFAQVPFWYWHSIGVTKYCTNY